MDLLLNNKFSPITHTIGFLETDVYTALKYFVKWQEDLLKNKSVNDFIETREIHGKLQDALNALLPLNSHEPRRHVFIPTASSWTSYFNNGWQGTDPLGLVSFIATEIHCRGLMITAIPDTINQPNNLNGRWFGALKLEMYGPKYINYQNVIRIISVVNDGGKWVFYEDGTPFSFEDTKQYKASRTQDRFSFNMLQRYLSALGLAPFDEDFYMPGEEEVAYLVEKKGPLTAVVKEYTLQEARIGN